MTSTTTTNSAARDAGQTPGAHGTIGVDYVFIHREKSPEQIAADIADADAEYACGLMGFARRDIDATDWDKIESLAEKAFDGWHKAGPQSAQY